MAFKKNGNSAAARRNDTLAKWVITLGGGLVIGCVILILALIFGVTLPLFTGSSAEVICRSRLPEGLSGGDVAQTGIGMSADGKSAIAYFLAKDGKAIFADLLVGGAAPAVVKTAELRPGGRILASEKAGGDRFSLLWADSSCSLVSISVDAKFDAAGKRFFACNAKELAKVPAESEDAAGATWCAVRLDDDGAITCARLHGGRYVTLSRLSPASGGGLFGDGGEMTSSRVELRENLPGRLTALALSRDGSNLYGGTDNGCLLWWRISEGELSQAPKPDIITAFADRRPVASLNMLLGDVSLAVGDGKGEASVWFAVNNEGAVALRRIHTLPSSPAGIEEIVPLRRTRSLLCRSTKGGVSLEHSTSERRLLELRGDDGICQVAVGERDDCLLTMHASGEVRLWRLDNQHPEVGWRTLFGAVHYEGYPDESYSWQTTGDDAFEPKFSLTPLIFGTFKGTFYAMLLAVPLAILAAMYVSQFTTPAFRGLIKPVVEIMAAVPSVVIGFIIALWLAPLVETWLIAVFLGLFTVPLAFVLFLSVWQRLRVNDAVKRFEHGREYLILLPVLLAGAGVAVLAAPPLEHVFFHPETLVRGSDGTVHWELWHNFGRRLLEALGGADQGNVRQALFDLLGQRYDQRNCVIIAFGLGFTVMPVIFSISEDALSSVPYNLRAASMALGASRWQTVRRVILPSASPGIFAAMMIGLGRAVGETMIVLMATGNTPLLSWSPFNGMRTLSANIATEIPEAPVGGTLYRLLFLCAVLLFMFTFVLNTAAEVVRQRLRKKYGRF